MGGGWPRDKRGSTRICLGSITVFILSNLPLLSKAKLTTAENTELAPSKTTPDLQVMNTIFLI